MPFYKNALRKESVRVAYFHDHLTSMTKNENIQITSTAIKFKKIILL